MPPPRRKSRSTIPRRRHAHTTLPDAITIGYYPLCDVAPVLVAQHLGFFRKQGLNVRLQKEIGWATIIKKLEAGEIHAAHAPASLLLQPWQNTPAPTTTLQAAYLLNIHGTSLTLATEFLNLGIKTGMDLAQHMLVHDRKKVLRVGVDSHFSAQKIYVQQWLEGLNIPEGRIEFMVLPPKQIPRNLSSGNIDAFCADEPWGNFCVLQGNGFAEVTPPNTKIPDYPQKAILTTRQFAKKNPEKHTALLRAIQEAAILCDQLEYHHDVAKILSHQLDVEPDIIEASFACVFPFGAERDKSLQNHLRFSGEGLNRPSADKGELLRDGLVAAGLVPSRNAPSKTELRSIFRSDIYDSIFDRHITPHPFPGF